jgi:hypothetical protein
MNQIYIIRHKIEGYFLEPMEGYTTNKEEAFKYTKEEILYQLDDYRGWLDDSVLIPLYPYNKGEEQ